MPPSPAVEEKSCGHEALRVGPRGGENPPRGCKSERDALGDHGPRHNHSFRGSFSAGSTPIFASKYAFFSIFRALQEKHLLASKFANTSYKIYQNFAKFLRNVWKFAEILQNSSKSCQILAKSSQVFASKIEESKCKKSTQAKNHPEKSNIAFLQTYC